MKMKSLLKKLGFFLLNITGISFLVSCIIENKLPLIMYGMIPLNYYTVSGKVFGDIDKDGTTEPIPKIKIEIRKKSADADNEYVVYEETTTDNDGSFFVKYRDDNPTDTEYIVAFSDVDDVENGSFLDKSIEINFGTDDLDEKQNFTKDIGTVELSNK